MVARSAVRAAIRPVTAADLPAVARYLAAAFRAPEGEARYQRIFDYPWLPAKPNYGFLIDDGGVRGVVGAIYSDRPTGRACNLTSVAVDASHRAHTLKLFHAVVAQPGLAAVTCFSASAEVQTILGFFKLTRWPAARVIVTLGSGLGGLRRGRARVWSTPADLAAALTPAEQTIARDHAGCGVILVERGGRRCFTVSVRRGRDVRAFTEVLHASDPELLVDALPWVMPRWLARHRTPLAGLDARWVREPPIPSFVYAGLRPVYARGLRIEQVDGLYSELVPMFAERSRPEAH